MAFTTLSIKNNNLTKHYILSYAHYLHEAWLSEVIDEKTKIVKQFKCRTASDLDFIVLSISEMGEIVNLGSNETIDQYLKSLNIQLQPNLFDNISESVVSTAQKIWTRMSFTLGHA